MSKHNYTNYSKTNNEQNNKPKLEMATPSYKNQNVEVEPEVVEVVGPVIIEPVTNDNEPKIVEPVTVEPEVKEPEVIVGVVTGCGKLNVRENPSISSKILCIISVGDIVEISDTSSFDNFYKICTGSGVEGYCVKEYIKLN